MGRWADRRAAKRARKSGIYLGDYYGQPEQPASGTPSPYAAEVPDPSSHGRGRRWRRRSRRRRGGRYGFPDWVGQEGRLDPAQAGQVARDQRRQPGSPSTAQATTTSSTSATTAGTRASDRSRRDQRTNSARTSTSDTRSRSAQRAPGTSMRRRWGLVGVVGGGALVAGLVIALAIPRGPDVSNRDHPEFENLWHTQVEDLDPDAPGSASLVSVDTVDRFGGTHEMITADAAWVLVVEQEDLRAVLALDPTDGSQVWRHDLYHVHCSHRVSPDGTLTCLAADSPVGQDWTGYVFDAATGDELESWPAPITGAWSVSWTEAGVAVLAESSPNTYDHLVLLDSADGSEIWTADLSAIDDDLLFSTRDIDDVETTYLHQVRWSGQGERIMLSTIGTMISAESETGELSVQDCYPWVDTGQRLGCSQFRESILYDETGEQLWSSDRVQLARTAHRGEHVLVNVADQSLHHTDWDSGYIGAPVESVGYNPIATGTSEHPFLVDEDDLLHIAPDGSQVHWALQVRGMNSITDVWVSGDVALVSGASTLALDLATGEELWQRYSPGNKYLIGSDLVAIGYRDISVLQLP